MADTLYLIENDGCHETTRGLVYISDKLFPKFKEFIENLNENSTYSCKPVIFVYDISIHDLRYATDEDDRDARLYLGEEVFVLKDSGYTWEKKPLICRKEKNNDQT